MWPYLHANFFWSHSDVWSVNFSPVFGPSLAWGSLGVPTLIATDIPTETTVSLREHQEFPLQCPFTWFHLLKSFTGPFTHSFIHSTDACCE